MVGAATSPAVHEGRFHVMGTDAHIVVVDGGDGLLRIGEGRARDLERRWSRFLDDSEVSELNRADGQPRIVSPETVELVERARIAWKATEGRFDPTVGAALIAQGYDRSFSELAAGAVPAREPVAVPGLAGLDVVPAINAVTLPLGVSFDPGGIGKGLAADLVAALLIESGAAGVLVNLGGDLRARGRAPDPEGWVVTVPDPLEPADELLRLTIGEGAVATSSRLERRWRTSWGEAHHLIDPRTGRPAETEVVAVTVVAAEGWWAEALSKALFLAGPSGLVEIDDVHAVLVTADGRRHATPDLEATLR